jgi:glycerophosphoryl diester phosphodiesterase
MNRVLVLILISVSYTLTAYPWRTSLTTCWNNVTCNRALIVSHGGDWTVIYPYDSLPAFQRAYDEGTDAVKGDFRVSKDNIGVVMHSSPITWYESPTCWGKKVEEMTAAECTSCQMALSSYKFISVPQLLSWAKDKVNVMLCIKNDIDIPRAITTLVENNATDRAFLEIKVKDLNRIKDVKGWEKVYYLAEGSSPGDIDTILSPSYAWLLPRIFTFEYDPAWDKWNINIQESIKKLHSKGVRTLTATATQLYPSVDSQEKLFTTGFDVVYTYDTQNGVIARTSIDKQRGVTPP